MRFVHCTFIFHSKKVFAWNNVENVPELNFQSAPTLTEREYNKIAQESQSVNDEIKQKLIERYGGEEHMQQLQEGVSAQSKYTEFTATGEYKDEDAKRPQIKAVSKYPEDVYHMNHTVILNLMVTFCKLKKEI